MSKNKPEPNLMDKLVALCKRRGIVFQSSEIYGGVSSTYDYGPYGAPLKDNIERLWLSEMTLNHEDIVQLDSAIILHPKVWETSGHVKAFHDPMVECRQCKRRFKTDSLIPVAAQAFMKNMSKVMRRYPEGGLVKPKDLPENSPERWVTEKYFTHLNLLEILREGELAKPGNEYLLEYFFKFHNQCPECGTKDSLLEPRDFNLMFRTNIGPTEDEDSTAYFRPETAQGIYVDYKIVQESARLKVPFGIAQTGKAFRNEITTQKFIFRTREFEQMEMQFFIKPGDNRKWLDQWKQQRWDWYLSLGVDPAKLRWQQHPQDKLAHYAREAWDVEYEFPFGWSEIEGVHDRGEFDLNAHQAATGKDLTYFDDESKERYIPHIIETSAGLNRIMLMLLCDGYREDEQAGEQRVYLSLNPKVAPVKAAVFPLVKKDGLAEIAREIYDSIRMKFPSFFDIQGSIGRRYRRMDEIGTPFCFTVDYQTKEDGTVTVRWRDTLKQERIGKDKVDDYLRDWLV